MYNIRKATEQDIPFIKANAYRLLDFGPPPWRTEDWPAMIQADIHHMSEAILSGSGDKEVFICTNDLEIPWGFLHITLQKDYYTGNTQAHIRDMAVTPEAEGKGIGKLLMEKADDWVKEKGCDCITLNVFIADEHAQRIYEKAGFQKEWIKYVKQL